MKVRYSDLALAELDAILAAIQAENPDTAASFEARVRRVAERIGQFPEGAQEVAERPGYGACRSCVTLMSSTTSSTTMRC